ncbi:GntR family transcriptional regulator [Streptomyces sp. CA-243310]|uniref:GntR family transcriptional regulator n=1 Tax=Streptomyces sp. CA-243310 TaxID=3240056 RepID=UPI003D8ABD2D
MPWWLALNSSTAIAGRRYTAPWRPQARPSFASATTCEAGARRQTSSRTRWKKEERVTNPSPRGTYLTISEALRARIAEGTYPDGLPSEAEIGREFGVARTTVRRALRALEEAGDVTTVAGVACEQGWSLGGRSLEEGPLDPEPLRESREEARARQQQRGRARRPP